MTLPKLVLTFDSTARVPVFHRCGDHEFQHQELWRGFEARFSEWRTPCGQLVSQQIWIEHHRPYVATAVLDYERRPTWLRIATALAMGRPCRRCFPEIPTEGAKT